MSEALFKTRLAEPFITSDVPGWIRSCAISPGGNITLMYKIIFHIG